MGGAQAVHVRIDFDLHPAVEKSIQQEWKVTMNGRLTADELSPLDTEVCHLLDHAQPVGGCHGSVIAPGTARGVAVLTGQLAPTGDLQRHEAKVVCLRMESHHHLLTTTPQVSIATSSPAMPTLSGTMP
jgi:hypothetical protein